MKKMHDRRRPARYAGRMSHTAAYTFAAFYWFRHSGGIG